METIFWIAGLIIAVGAGLWFLWLALSGVAMVGGALFFAGKSLFCRNTEYLFRAGVMLGMAVLYAAVAAVVLLIAAWLVGWLVPE